MTRTRKILNRKAVMVQSAYASALVMRLGGLTAVAQSLGVSRQAVYMWCRRGIPKPRAEDLKRAFGLKKDEIELSISRGRGFIVD